MRGIYLKNLYHLVQENNKKINAKHTLNPYQFEIMLNAKAS